MLKRILNKIRKPGMNYSGAGYGRDVGFCGYFL
jgi:hypothetical protein